MAEELTPDMLEEAAPDLLTLEDEDGKECTFEVVDVTEIGGTRYSQIINPKTMMTPKACRRTPS